MLSWKVVNKRERGVCSEEAVVGRGQSVLRGLGWEQCQEAKAEGRLWSVRLNPW